MPWAELFGQRSEGVPGAAGRELQIADIHTEAGADAGLDRNEDDAVDRERRHADPADHIGRAVDAGKAPQKAAGSRQIVNEDHRPRAFAADVEADGRALPVDGLFAAVLHIKLAVAIAQAD